MGKRKRKRTTFYAVWILPINRYRKKRCTLAMAERIVALMRSKGYHAWVQRELSPVGLGPNGQPLTQ